MAESLRSCQRSICVLVGLYARLSILLRRQGKGIPCIVTPWIDGAVLETRSPNSPSIMLRHEHFGDSQRVLFVNLDGLLFRSIDHARLRKGCGTSSFVPILGDDLQADSAEALPAHKKDPAPAPQDVKASSHLERRRRKGEQGKARRGSRSRGS